ncbi:hypothetical protein LINGRAPRIM_LOCUS2045 [Linum grandiflorum]
MCLLTRITLIWTLTVILQRKGLLGFFMSCFVCLLSIQLKERSFCA